MMASNPNPFDIVVETQEGLYILIASSSNRQYAAIVAESLYTTGSKEARPGRNKVASVVVRDMGDPREPILMDIWPESWNDRDGSMAAMERYRKRFG
jgi:hypothetical protein